MTAVDCCRQLEELNVGELHLHLGIQPVQYCAQLLTDNLADLLLTCPSALGKLHLAAAVAEAVAVAGEAAVVAEAEAASEAQVAVAGVPVAAEVVVTDKNKKKIIFYSLYILTFTLWPLRVTSIEFLLTISPLNYSLRS